MEAHLRLLDEEAGEALERARSARKVTEAVASLTRERRRTLGIERTRS